jgi:hypothetical protein
MGGRRIRVAVTRPGLEWRDREAKAVARAPRDPRMTAVISCFGGGRTDRTGRPRQVSQRIRLGQSVGETFDE